MAGADAEGDAGRADPAPPDATGGPVRVHIEHMAHGGEGLGRDADGRVVFVDGGLPGETVWARVTEHHARHARGVLEALDGPPADARIADPRCPHFGAWPARGRAPDRHCGGCQWQHAAEGAQRTHKRAVLVDALERQGGLSDPPVGEVEGVGAPWAYRNSLHLRVGPAGRPGLVAHDGRSHVALDACPIAHPALLELAGAVEGDLAPGTGIRARVGVHTGDRLIAIDDPTGEIDGVTVGVDASVVLVGPDGALDVAAGRSFLVETLVGVPFAIPATSFFQVNTDAAERLAEHVRAALPDGLGTLVDLYSGVGTLAVLCADRAAQVFAIEIDRHAVAAAVDNAAGLEHLTLLEAPAAEGLEHLSGGQDAAIVDPPRGGIAPDVLALLADRTRDTIVYVSCEPVTLARDARRLAERGWRMASCQPLDMFPQTYHIESVSVFRR